MDPFSCEKHFVRHLNHSFDRTILDPHTLDAKDRRVSAIEEPEKRAHALSLALGKPLLVLLRFRCPCLLLVGDALFQGKRSSLLRLRRSARCQGQPALEVLNIVYLATSYQSENLS